MTDDEIATQLDSKRAGAGGVALDAEVVERRCSVLPNPGNVVATSRIEAPRNRGSLIRSSKKTAEQSAPGSRSTA